MLNRHISSLGADPPQEDTRPGTDLTLLNDPVIDSVKTKEFPNR